ncbi:MAG: PEP-CTERM sorting domain-containing protein, partial [Chthoniobacterales bacterium]
NTRLYVIGFNGGTFATNNVAGAWSGATEYGVVSAFGHTTNSQNFLSPADNGTKALNFSATTVQLTSSDVLKGSLASSNTVTMVPEPSTYALLALSGLALGGYAMRRRRRA